MKSLSMPLRSLMSTRQLVSSPRTQTHELCVQWSRVLNCSTGPHTLTLLIIIIIVYNRYDHYFKNRADYGLTSIWSVWVKFLLLPISCTDFNNVGSVTEIIQNWSKNVGKTLKLNPKCDYQSIIFMFMFIDV